MILLGIFLILLFFAAMFVISELQQMIAWTLAAAFFIIYWSIKILTFGFVSLSRARLPAQSPDAVRRELSKRVNGEQFSLDQIQSQVKVDAPLADKLSGRIFKD
jgi:hypothetical protein